MKVKILSLMLILASCMCLSSCSDDDEPKFNYSLEMLHGTWEATDVFINGKWVDITNSYLYSELQMSITFYEDGNYYGKGFFGNGRGTYKAVGNTITTYVDGEIYFTYVIKNLTNTTAELGMYDRHGESLQIKATKKQ